MFFLCDPDSLSSMTTDTDGADASLTRRSSSGGLLSPEVAGAPAEHDGFYMLKKDSQRRTTLSRVLSQDQANICQVWLSSVRQDVADSVLNMGHLETLMCGLREYIANQNKDQLETAIHTLKEDLEFDSVAINQLHLAIYLFQDAVNVVLRSHSIKPHWMFALDNLVRNSVQAAITVLSPELGANLMGQEEKEVPRGGVGGDVPSVPSTVNSLKSKNTSIDSFASSIKLRHDFREQMNGLRAENQRLMQELLDGQKVYQTLLKQALEDHRLQLTALRQVVEQMGLVTSLLNHIDRESSESETSAHTPESNGGERLLPQISVTDSSVDPRLVEWLRTLRIDQCSIDKVIYSPPTSQLPIIQSNCSV
ncbi:hypothetical protein J6590_078847 [Homalodisca vitripennis]|nr:hypothetical protein J6590_078847 [Homalodisca vitripennis]